MKCLTLGIAPEQMGIHSQMACKMADKSILRHAFIVASCQHRHCWGILLHNYPKAGGEILLATMGLNNLQQVRIVLQLAIDRNIIAICNR